jgi:hypothetical protein
MQKTYPDSLNNSRVMLIELIDECPLVVNPNDCPLHERRQLPMDEKVKWVNPRSNDKCLQICLTLCG